MTAIPAYNQTSMQTRPFLILIRFAQWMRSAPSDVCREKGRDRRSKVLYLMPEGDISFQMPLEMGHG
jgi:hypothetical protein